MPRWCYQLTEPFLECSTFGYQEKKVWRPFISFFTQSSGHCSPAPCVWVDVKNGVPYGMFRLVLWNQLIDLHSRFNFGKLLANASHLWQRIAVFCLTYAGPIASQKYMKHQQPKLWLLMSSSWNRQSLSVRIIMTGEFDFELSLS